MSGEPSTFSLKEIVGLVEERFPWGRHVSTGVLSLIVLVLVVGCINYLRQYAIIPIIHLVASAISGHQQLGTTLVIVERVADIAVLVVFAVVFTMITHVLGRIVNLQGKGVEAHNEIVEHIEKLTRRLDGLEGRIDKLESHQ